MGVFLLLANAVAATANITVYVAGIGDTVNLAIGILNAVVTATMVFGILQNKGKP